MKPKTFFRYTNDALQSTALVLNDLTILEVKRNGVPTKRHFETYAEWIATLPAGAEVHVDAPPAKPVLPPPQNDAEWLLRGMGKRGLGYHYVLQTLAGPRYSFKGQRPTYYIFGDGPVPQLLRVSSCTFPVRGPSTIFYGGKVGTSFTEVGIPVDAETGWPNMWRIAPGGQFKKCPCPCPRA
jgi:hypothetical protein